MKNIHGIFISMGDAFKKQNGGKETVAFVFQFSLYLLRLSASVYPTEK